MSKELPIELMPFRLFQIIEIKLESTAQDRIDTTFYGVSNLVESIVLLS